MWTQPGGSGDVGVERAGGARGMLEGLVPVALLAIVVAVGVALTIGMRLATTGQGFEVAQTATVVVMVAAIAIAALVYLVASIRALRRVRALELAGNQARARGVLWGLALTALIVLVPILVAAVLPQHPAP